MLDTTANSSADGRMVASAIGIGLDLTRELTVGFSIDHLESTRPSSYLGKTHQTLTALQTWPEKQWYSQFVYLAQMAWHLALESVV
jgi:hypothetical protein